MIAPHAPVLLTTIIQKELTCLISVTRKSFIKKMFFDRMDICVDRMDISPDRLGPYGHFREISKTVWSFSQNLRNRIENIRLINYLN